MTPSIQPTDTDFHRRVLATSERACLVSIQALQLAEQAIREPGSVTQDQITEARRVVHQHVARINDLAD